jgi:hypothetical protein
MPTSPHVSRVILGQRRPQFARRICLTGLRLVSSRFKDFLLSIDSPNVKHSRISFKFTAQMDPTTAFGLAANVAQFISFTIDLITKTKEIHRSAKGLSDEALTLQSVYQHLQALGTDLQQSAVNNTNAAIRNLSNICMEDCKKILRLLEDLQKGPKRSNVWRSFKLALKEYWKSSEIGELEKRLQRTQAALTLEITSMNK